jgi:hypothetical protein
MGIRKVKEFSLGMNFMINGKCYSISYFPTRTTVHLKYLNNPRKEHRKVMFISYLRKQIEKGNIRKTGWF